MNLTQSMFHEGWMKALGWTFVHSIWQIAVIGLLLLVILRLIPGRSAHVRYTMTTMALWLVLITVLSTFIVMLPEKLSITQVTGKVFMLSTGENQTIIMQLSQWLENRMPMLLTIWFGGVGILMLRLLFSLGWVHHLRYDSFPEEQLQETLHQIISRLKLKVKAVTSESYLISSPVTIGHLKPLILFPVGIINQLSPKEVEAILTHELAHIVRRDYLSNLVQSFIETLFYYHPVTWWISRMVRTERENRADDLAISWCGDQLGYAKALMAVQEMQIQHAPHLTIGFASRKGAMLARIQRILNLPYKNHNQMEKTVLLSLCSLCFLAFTLTSHTPDNSPAKEKSSLTLFPATIVESMDTIPAKGTYRIHKKTDAQEISIEVEDGDIRELTVDGKKIEPGSFEAYDEVINELFGILEEPHGVEYYPFTMPPMPPMPPMPSMPSMPPMPDLNYIYEYDFEIPDMPDLSKLELEELLNDNNVRILRYGENLGNLHGERLHDLRVITDTLSDGNHRIIMIEGKDTSVICTPGIGFVWPDQHHMEMYMNDENLLRKSEEQWRDQWKGQADAWREQAEEWRKQQQEWREQFRHQQQKMREGQARLREEMGRMKEKEMHWNEGNPGVYFWDKDAFRELEEQARAEEGIARAYTFSTPRTSMSDQMVEDGLIEPGQEVEVQLTPDKLRINGKKMGDDLHQKYLEMYERQQGVELSGNSRVEFITKSRQRM